MGGNKQEPNSSSRHATEAHQGLCSMSERIPKDPSTTYLKGVAGTALISAFLILLDTIPGEVSNK